MIPEAIRRQIKAGENAGIEFKSDAANFESIAAAVCGFLNAKGGTVFVGVDDDGTIVGVGDDVEERRRSLELHLKSAISPTALFTVSVDEEDGRWLITIEAPAGRDRPYVVDGRTYVRHGQTTRPADSQELRDLIQDRSVESLRWERRTSPGLDVDDLDLEELNKTWSQAGKLFRIVPREQTSPLDALRELGMAASSGLTQGCDVAFAKEPAQRLPQCRLRYIRFASDKVGDTYLDNRWIQGPVFKVFDEVIQRLSAQVEIQASFQPGEVERRDRPSYSLDALREGLVNALAHRDYSSFSGGISVSVFRKRIEIWNSGRLGLDVKELRTNHPSVPTNPDITQVFYLRNLMERTGRGTLKIIAGCKAVGGRANWEDKPSGVTLTLSAAAEGPTEELLLNPRQRALIARLRPGDAFRISEYLDELQDTVTERQARRDLAQLEEMGLIVRFGQARATSYRRTDTSL